MKSKSADLSEEAILAWYVEEEVLGAIESLTLPKFSIKKVTILA